VLQGEANLTFNGSTLTITGNALASHTSLNGTSPTNTSQINTYNILGSIGNTSMNGITYTGGGGGGAAIGMGRGSSWDTFMTFYTNPVGTTTGGAITERMRINSVGRVLIGKTSDDGNILQINGSMTLPQNTNIWFGNPADSGNRFRFHLASDNNSYVDFATGNLFFRADTSPVIEFRNDGSLVSATGVIRTNVAFSVLDGSTGDARGMRMGSLLVSNAYADSGSVPTNGAYIKGVIRGGDDIVAYFSSDERLKDNIEIIESPLNKIEKIGGYSFEWNDKQDTYTGRDYGVIAQEIEEILPELVTTRDNGYKAVKYEKIIPLLIESIKELKSEIDKLKK
jgi:hypothetical protein